MILALLPNHPDLTKTTLFFGKPEWNFSLLVQIPRFLIFLENGPYIPSTQVHSVPATATAAEIPERTIVKEVHEWTESILTLRQDL